MHPAQTAGIPSADLFIDTPGGRLFTRIWGAEPGRYARTPIVLLHESLGCVEVWRGFPARLAEATGRPVIAYDRLGFGRSDAYPAPFPTDFIRREADEGFADLRQGLGLDRFILFGHSVGGGMAVGIAAVHADACRALITEAAQSYAEPLTRDSVAAARQTFAPPEQLARIARYHGDKAAFVLSAWVDMWPSPAFDGWSLDPDLPQVRCPALVMHGAADPFGTPSHAERIANGVGGPATLRILEDCKHVPHVEHEQVVLDEVAAFLRTAVTD